MNLKSYLYILTFVCFCLFTFFIMPNSLAEEKSISLWDKLNIIPEAEVGAVSYREEGAGLESDWDSTIFKVSLGMVNEDNKSWESEVKFGYFTALSGKETWKVEGIEYQRNDMDFWGWDFSWNLGYAFNIKYYTGSSGEQENLTFTPFVGYGYRNIQFSRSNFNVLNLITITKTVDEDYDIHHLDLGLKVNRQLRNNLNLSLGFLGGYVISNEADNSELGEIKGDGGYLIRGFIDLDYKISNVWKISIGFVGEQQSLKGGESGLIIWPDNKLESYSGFVKFTYVWGERRKSLVKSNNKSSKKKKQKPRIPLVVAPEDKPSYTERKETDSERLQQVQEEQIKDSSEEKRDWYYRMIHEKLSEYIKNSRFVSSHGSIDLFLTIGEEGDIKGFHIYSKDIQLKKVVEDILRTIPPFPAIPQELGVSQIQFKLKIIFG